MAGKNYKRKPYEKDVACSSEKPVLETPRLNWEVNINLILGVRKCDSMGLFAVTLGKRPVEDSCERGNEYSPPSPFTPKNGILSTTWRILASQERLGFMELVSVTFM